MWAMNGMLLKYLFQHITYMSITGNNPEKPLYTGPGHFLWGIPVTVIILVLMLEVGLVYSLRALSDGLLQRIKLSENLAKVMGKRVRISMLSEIISEGN